MLTSLALQDIGSQKGKHYSVNFPLKDGIDDESYQSIFKPVRLLLDVRRCMTSR